MNNLEKQIIITKNEKDEINIDTEKALHAGIDETVAELLEQLYIENNNLYKEVLNLVDTKESQMELKSFLLLIQIVFTKHALNLDFEESKWLEIKNTISVLKEKYTVLNQIIKLYLENVQLENINPALTKENIVNAKNQLNRYFNSF